MNKPAQEQPAGAPLARYNVLDLTRVRAGPTAIRQLSDWGADVIKVESPAEDDMTGSRDGSDFQNLNRNKRSIIIDLKSEKGRDILRRFVERADVLCENFRPDVKHRLGIDYEALRAINPRLVYASISGFGQDGPYRLRPGFDQIAQAMGGMLSINGETDGRPLRVGVPIADLCSGLYCAIGILVALLQRETTGEGQWIRTSLLQAQIGMLDFQAVSWLMDGKVPGRTGNNHPYTVPMGVYPASDGDIIIGASSQAQYVKFCDVIGAPDLVADARFASAPDRTRNRGAMNDEISRRTREKSKAYWVEKFNEAGVACGPINTIDEVFADPQVEAAGIVHSYPHPRLGNLPLIGSPIQMSSAEAVVTSAAPDKGEHTDVLLRSLGLSDLEIDLARAAGAVG